MSESDRHLDVAFKIAQLIHKKMKTQVSYKQNDVCPRFIEPVNKGTRREVKLSPHAMLLKYLSGGLGCIQQFTEQKGLLTVSTRQQNITEQLWPQLSMGLAEASD